MNDEITDKTPPQLSDAAKLLTLGFAFAISLFFVGASLSIVRILWLIAGEIIMR